MGHGGGVKSHVATFCLISWIKKLTLGGTDVFVLFPEIGRQWLGCLAGAFFSGFLACPLSKKQVSYGFWSQKHETWCDCVIIYQGGGALTEDRLTLAPQRKPAVNFSKTADTMRPRRWTKLCAAGVPTQPDMNPRGAALNVAPRIL